MSDVSPVMDSGRSKPQPKAEAKAAAPKAPKSILKDHKTDDAPKKAAAASGQEPKQSDRKPKQVRTQAEPVKAPAAPSRPASQMANITALVLPPYSLSKALMESIEDTYNVIETEKLDVEQVEKLFKKKSAKKSLVVLASLKDITE